MLVFKWFSVLALAAVAYAEVEQPTELVIDTTYLPEDCPIKSQKGDQLSVHYVGSASVGLARVTNQLLDWKAMDYWRGV